MVIVNEYFHLVFGTYDSDAVHCVAGSQKCPLKRNLDIIFLKLCNI